MPIDDLWYLKKKRDPKTKKLLPSKRYGRGKRWRVRYVDADGADRERLFDLKRDAEAFDLDCRSGAAPAVHARGEEARLTFGEYARRWAEARESGWATETRKRIPQNLRKHLAPAFGDRSIRAINLTDVMGWLGRMLDAGVPKSSVSLYFGLFKTIMTAARVDKIIPDNPCDGVKLAQVLRGLNRVPKWVPTEDQVLRLVDVVPRRYRAAIWLGAGAGLRLGEVLGMEEGPRCADPDHGQLHVVQQLRHSREHFGGFYLATPKSGSSGTVDLDAVVAEELAAHTAEVGSAVFELPDITTGERQTREVALMFTSVRGKLITDTYWPEMWAQWRQDAGWPKQGTFHSLRHFFATTLMSNGVEPQEVQKALRHANLRITLETYVHWLPKKDRPRGLIGTLLREADTRRDKRPSEPEGS